MEFFCQHLVHAAAAASEAAHPPFERFLMRGMLFLNATLRSNTFRGTTPVHFRVSEAAQEQVRMLTGTLYKSKPVTMQTTDYTFASQHLPCSSDVRAL
jgi:hypothetical protein